MQFQLPKRFLTFTAVGVSGIFVNQAVLFYVHDSLKVPLAIASLIAIQIAIINNFIWNRQFTWTDRPMKGFQAIKQGLIKFTLVSWVAGTLNWIILMILSKSFGIHYMIANLAAILVASILNYFLNDLWTFRRSHDGSSD
jgi:dolichol-phosphate mannosyltransferase